MTSALLFRDTTEEDPYRAAFEAAGFQVQHQTVLHFRTSNHDALVARLSSPEKYAGVIITSARALGPLVELLDADVDLKQAWTAKPFYAVGPASAARAGAVGFVVQGQEAGNAMALAKLVARRKNEDPWLFLCRRCHCEDLPGYLEEQGQPTETLVVYESTPNTELAFVEASEPDWVLFFSPAGARVAREAWPASWQRVRFAAIGPKTAKKLQSLFGRVDAVAKKPTPASLLDAVTAAGLSHP